MRGYTRKKKPARSAGSVSPVHAGIYPIITAERPPLKSFPRSCGDIPASCRGFWRLRRFPPFMRGYTWQSGAGARVHPVSPVHAGIYPADRRAAHEFHGFPRSCGDIPYETWRVALEILFPPFMRGYTWLADIERKKREVSPVHAGIYLWKLPTR